MPDPVKTRQPKPATRAREMRLTQDDLWRLFRFLQEGLPYRAPDGTIVTYEPPPPPAPSASTTVGGSGMPAVQGGDVRGPGPATTGGALPAAPVPAPPAPSVPHPDVLRLIEQTRGRL